MITALQHFISKKGKFVFILLLLLVIVSFVLYLSQGSSVFDLMSDGGREKKEFYGYDWNDPDQRRFLNITSRAAGSVGALISPTQDVVNKADDSYIQGLRQQIQAAFRANPEEVDQDAMQRMFQYMQAWPNFSRDFKISEIARSGAYDAEFLDESIKARVALAGQADAWGLLPQNINHPGINTEFINFLTSLDPVLQAEENRSSVLSMIGSRFGMTGSEIESVLYSSFRDAQVDQIYANRGFALAEEVDVLSHQNGFAWDGEAAIVSVDDLPDPKIFWGEISITGTPKAGEQLVLTYSNKKLNLEFGNSVDDKNGTVTGIPLADDPKQIAQYLNKVINANDIGIRASIIKNTNVRLQLMTKSFPRTAPQCSSKSSVVSFKDLLSSKLTEFHGQNSDLDAFIEQPRTFATAMVFPSKRFFNEPPPPDEARLRSYFDRNRLDFLKDPKVEKNTEDNNSALLDVNFEEVAEEVRKKVTSQDLADANNEADRLAKNAALEFLDQLNSFSDRIKRNYPDFISLRNSSEFGDFLKQSGADQRKISFSSKDMNVQTMVLGLERRSSEQRANKDPLLEVESLNETKFFTRSVRKSRDGHVVFLLDRKVKQQPAKYNDIVFSALCQEYLKNIRNSQFSKKVAAIQEKISSDPQANDPALQKFKFSIKNAGSARTSFDSRQRTLQGKISKLETSRTEIEKSDKKATALVDKKLSELQDQVAKLRKERSAVMGVLEDAENLKVDRTWVELERSEGQAIFGFLSSVYSIQGKQMDAEQKTSMNTNLERSRGLLARDETIREILSVNLDD